MNRILWEMQESSEQTTYEDRFGRLSRRIRRVARAIRWRLKGALGMERRVLAEMNWRLGDEIMALPIYDAMRDAWPQSSLTVMTNYPALFEGKTGVAVVDGDTRTTHFTPDRYICLRDASRTEYRPVHYARLAGVPAPVTRPRIAFATWDTNLLTELPGTTENRIALAPGTTWATKHWADENWAALAGKLADAGYAPLELGKGRPAVSGAYSLVDKTSVRDAACVLRACRFVVSPDSGLMHLALAVGTPVVALFGPTDPSILVRDEPKLHVITNERPCQGCWNISLAMKEPGLCPMDIPDCLGTITVDRVFDTLRAAAPLDH